MNDPEDDNDVTTNTKKRKTSTTAKTKKRKKLPASSMIDDAAVLSGSESSEEEEDDENENDYIRDGFVVDEREEEKKKVNDGLEDSDDDDSDDDDEDDNRNRSKVRRMRDTDRLDEDDLALINEARGVNVKRVKSDEDRGGGDNNEGKTRIKARSEAELRKGLFDASDDEGDAGAGGKGSKGRGAADKATKKKKRAVDTFDEDGMDDFIEYDEDAPRNHRDDDDELLGNREGISEAQLNQANDIFGTDFLDFMAGTNDDDEDYEEKDTRYRERGVGVDLGVGSDEDMEDDSSDDDLFASDDDESSGLTKDQRAEALRLKKEKRQIKKEERRKAVALKKSDRRKANLRRAFEPVQLIENFCTERDDEIRSKDVPERFFDWNTPFHGPADASVKSFSLQEEEEAAWIATRVPAIAAEFSDIATIYTMDDMNAMDAIEAKQRTIVTSIIQALRYMHRENLEPDFIRKYREDYVTSPAVRANLYAVMDEDTEFERIVNAKRKVETLLGDLIKIAESDDALGADEENVAKLKEDLKIAQERLDESVRDEERITTEIGDLDKDDDDDDLFGDEDDDEDKEKVREMRMLPLLVPTLW